jgi:hypothetical protein
MMDSTPAAEIFAANTASFAVTGNMLAARSSHTATLLPDGRVLIAGGSIDTSAELYE